MPAIAPYDGFAPQFAAQRLSIAKAGAVEVDIGLAEEDLVRAVGRMIVNHEEPSNTEPTIVSEKRWQKYIIVPHGDNQRDVVAEKAARSTG
jgi:hypothetical protein